MTQNLDGRTLAFYALLFIGFVAAIFHFVDGRYGNGALALSAVIIGLLIQRELSSMPRPAEEPVKPEDEAIPLGPGGQRQVETPNRTNWLSNSVIAGFPATVVMTMVLIAGYLFCGALAQEDGNLLGRWFHGLTNNPLADGAFDVPLGAYSINLLAGLIWAVVYGYLFEPRLSGPGWRRGMLFSTIPWLLSLVVFFPVVGAGIFGAALGAGPLPAIGNLILHLSYGAVLGSLYALPDRSPADATQAMERDAELQNRGMTIGLVGGLTVGMIVGSFMAIFVSTDVASPTEMLLAGAAVGITAGAVAGPLIGLSSGSRTGVNATSES
jgi:hypothetical protein